MREGEKETWGKQGRLNCKDSNSTDTEYEV